MKPKTKQSPESVVREIRRKTHRKSNSGEKTKVILEGIKFLCRSCGGINSQSICLLDIQCKCKIEPPNYLQLTRIIHEG